MGKNKNGKQKQKLEEVPEEEEEEYYDYSAEEDEGGYGLADMLGEDNWAAGATAGHDPWGVNKTVQQTMSNQWGSTIPTPAQLAAHHAAAAASGSKGGGGGKKADNNKKADKKGKGGNGGGWDNNSQPADAWGGNGGGGWGAVGGGGGWGSGGGWAATTDANDWGPPGDDQRWDVPQPGKPVQGHWSSWGEEAKRLPKVTSVPTSTVGTRNDLSAQQRSEILQALLNHPNQGHDVRSAYQNQHTGGQQEQPKGGKQQQQQKQKQQNNEQGQGKKKNKQNNNNQQASDPWGVGDTGGAWGGGGWGDGGWGDGGGGDWGMPEAEDKGKGKKNKKQQQKQQKQRQNDPWGDDGGWGMPGGDHDDYNDMDDRDRRVHFTPITANLWGGSQHDSTYHMPSKTLAHAYQGTTTPLFTGAPRNKVSEGANVQFVDSKGAALQSVHQALFGKTRMAKDRIHWMFSPNKDERVASLLAWIEIMSYNLGAYGLHRFLQSRERGALIANADYRPPHSPNEPAFDWLTFDQLQATRDRILQESVAFYDPAVTCIVFVFLPSKSGNSVAMWRRRISIGNNTRASRINEIHLAMAGLRREKDYVVHVDEIPGAKPSEPTKAAAALAAKSTPRNYDYYYPYESEAEKKPKKRKWWHFCM